MIKRLKNNKFPNRSFPSFYLILTSIRKYKKKPPSSDIRYPTRLPPIPILCLYTPRQWSVSAARLSCSKILRRNEHEQTYELKGSRDWRPLRVREWWSQRDRDRRVYTPALSILSIRWIVREYGTPRLHRPRLPPRVNKGVVLIKRQAANTRRERDYVTRVIRQGSKYIYIYRNRVREVFRSLECMKYKLRMYNRGWGERFA